MISVIVPVYNVELYLPDFLSSLSAQAYTDLEILLIDDDSSDNGYALCQEWSRKDSRFHTFHLKHVGVSEARNFGLQQAHGSYIAFADPDDMLHPALYQLLYNAIIENDADLVICHEQSFYDSQIPIIHPIQKYTVIELSDCLNTFQHFLDPFTGYIGWVWNKLYKSSLLKGIQFPKYEALEDLYFNLDVTMNVHRCIWIKERLYFYRQRSGSIMNTSSSTRYINYAEVLAYQLEKASLFQDNELYVQHLTYIENKLLQLYAQACSDHHKKAGSKILNLYHTIRKSNSIYSPADLNTSIKYLMKRFTPKLYMYHMKRLGKL